MLAPTSMSSTRNTFQLILFSGACLAVAAVLKSRARRFQKHRPPYQYDQVTPDKREYELVKDIVYIDNSYTGGGSHPRAPFDDNQILVIGVCGGSGSGKTTLSRAIINEFGADRVSYLSHDYYYRDLSDLTIEQRAEVNFDHPDSLESDLMIKHLERLKNNEQVEIPIYDFTTHSRRPERTLMLPKKVILVEGILIFADPKLAELMDIKIFVETAADIRFVRRLRRDMEERGRSADSVMDQYMKTVRPMHMMFVEASKRAADIIIPHGVNSVALDMILSRLHHFTSFSNGSEASSE